MLTRTLVVMAIAGLVTTRLVTPVKPAPPMLATYKIDLVQVRWAPTPATFGIGGNSAPSPARCQIIDVEDPHVSTYGQVINKVSELKGNALAQCDVPVDEMTLSVSIFDHDLKREVKEGPIAQNKGQKTLNSRKTTLPCVNDKMTTYQIGALGTSYEHGQEYWQIKFGNVGPVPCGHA
jgi:hypothetical protein